MPSKSIVLSGGQSVLQTDTYQIGMVSGSITSQKVVTKISSGSRYKLKTKSIEALFFLNFAKFTFPVNVQLRIQDIWICARRQPSRVSVVL